MGPTEPFESIRVSAIEASETPKWLVSGLWVASGCGVIGGEPNACKTWLALDMALSVASRTPCLDHFDVPEAGPVLLYLADHSLPSLRERLTALARNRGLDLAGLPLHTLAVPALRIDHPEDQERLAASVERLEPRLLILDPLVRISSAHAIGDALLYLRTLQRRFDAAIALVHHDRAARATGRQRRGIDPGAWGDLHAWADSRLSVRKTGQGLVVSVEHREAPAPEAFGVGLTEGQDGMLLRLTQAPPRLPIQKDQPSLRDRILAALELGEPEALAVRDLRVRLGVSNDALRATLKLMEQEGQVTKARRGYQLV